MLTVWRKNGTNTYIKYNHAKKVFRFPANKRENEDLFYSDWFLHNENEESGKDTLVSATNTNDWL